MSGVVLSAKWHVLVPFYRANIPFLRDFTVCFKVILKKWDKGAPSSIIVGHGKEGTKSGRSAKSGTGGNPNHL